MVFYLLTIVSSPSFDLEWREFLIWVILAHAVGELVTMGLETMTDPFTASTIGLVLVTGGLFIVLQEYAEIRSLKKRSMILIAYFLIGLVIDRVYDYLANYPV